MQNTAALAEVVDLLIQDARDKGAEVIVGIESRGFIFAAPMSVGMDLPLVLARKIGKLPFDRVSEEYALEYGTATIEMHTDTVSPGQRVYIVDDLLATGGTAAATAKLVEKLDGRVCGFGFMIELEFLNGREALSSYPTTALIRY
jgi:adenine phosphoribosyltransferase